MQFRLPKTTQEHIGRRRPTLVQVFVTHHHAALHVEAIQGAPD